MDDLIEEMLHTGDPLADAVVALFAGRPEARAELDAGLRDATVAGADPTLDALLQQLRTTSASVADDVLDVCPLPFFSISNAGHAFDLGAGALVDSYLPPESAAILVATGDLTQRTLARLQETAQWVSAAMVPGWLRPGQPGYLSTVRVRIAHAQVRAAMRRRRRDEAWHPVNQIELARTWLVFTLTAMRCDEAIGLDLTDAEQRSIYRYWQHIGALLGVDSRLIGDVVDRDSAEALAARIAPVIGAPSADSRRLTAAALAAISGELPNLSTFSPRLSGPLVMAISRRMQGTATADLLGIPRGPMDLVLPPAVALIRWQRRRQRARPDAWQAAITANIAVARDFALSDLATGQPAQPMAAASG